MKILGDSIKSLPWQEKPADCKAAIWRHSDNPVIDRNPAPGIARIFNSAVVPWKDGINGSLIKIQNLSAMMMVRDEFDGD